jgi:hypothetical protein
LSLVHLDKIEIFPNIGKERDVFLSMIGGDLHQKGLPHEGTHPTLFSRKERIEREKRKKQEDRNEK